MLSLWITMKGDRTINICDAYSRVFSLNFRELSKIISRKYTILKITFIVRISGWNFVRVPKPMHRYKVSAWNSHKNYDFCNTQISREYIGGLAKRYPWSNLCASQQFAIGTWKIKVEGMDASWPVNLDVIRYFALYNCCSQSPIEFQCTLTFFTWLPHGDCQEHPRV